MPSRAGYQASAPQGDAMSVRPYALTTVPLVPFSLVPFSYCSLGPCSRHLRFFFSTFFPSVFFSPSCVIWIGAMSGPMRFTCVSIIS